MICRVTYYLFINYYTKLLNFSENFLAVQRSTAELRKDPHVLDLIFFFKLYQMI